MKQRLDKEERLAQQADAQALARRSFLQRAAGLAAVTAMAPAAFARNFGPSTEPQRYPDPDIVALDKRFKYKLGNTPIQRLYTGTLWAEGCAWNGVEPLPRVERHPAQREPALPGGGRPRQPDVPLSGHAQQRQHLRLQRPADRFCHGSRDVRRYEHDGSVTVLADKNDEGKELNAPNDGMVHPNDGSIWFTDPGYGALMNYEGKRYSTGSLQPFIKEAVYRIDAQSGKVTKVTDEPFKPNGMCFSHDYKKVYIADTGKSHYPDAKSIIWVYDVDGEKLKNGKVFAEMTLDGKTGLRRWHPLRRGRQPLGRHGVGRRRLRRRAHLCARRHPYRPDPPAGDLRQCLLRRDQAQPPVHGREPVALRGLRGDAWPSISPERVIGARG